MRDFLFPGSITGYCTNVHAGADWAQTRASLERYALAVKARLTPESPMGIGLWLSARSARELCSREAGAGLRDWLARQGLEVFTMNGFPYGDFHQDEVRYSVYQPDWSKPERLAYTLDLATILVGLLPEQGEGSISTLPVTWGTPRAEKSLLERAVGNLLEAARFLHELEERTGRLLHLNLEPEPGCFLQRGQDVIDLYEHHLFRSGMESVARRHLRVCHDICHAAVMFEPQSDLLESYARAGIQVGKVQVSSAVRVPFDALASEEKVAALGQLKTFSDRRYLHQTVIRRPDSSIRFHDDLSEALETVADGELPTGEWRVHFHVPVYLERFGHVQTSRSEIQECLELLARRREVTHYEVETYAWDVLPDELRSPQLADGIARELEWFHNCAERMRSGEAVDSRR